MKLSRIHAFLTAACLTVCLAPTAFEDIHANAIYYAWTEAEDSDYIDDIRYDFFSDHVVVSHCEKGGDIVIPAEIEGLPVTDIFDGAFYSDTITSIVLPDSIKSLSSHMCSSSPNLRSVKLPANITSIPEHAFSDCRSLEEINIPSGVTEIGRFAFFGCTSLKKIDLPDGLLTLGDNCFCDCSLGSVTIPKGVTELPNWCFGGNSFKELTIPEHVKKIDYQAFNYCYNLEKLTVLNPQCEIESSLDCVFGGARLDANGYPAEGKVPCTCYGYKGSTLEKLANESTAKSAGFTFVALDAEKVVSLGDPNGDGKINAVDASIILSNYARFSTSDEKPTADETASCDVNKDGKINAVDASTVLSYYAYCATNEAVAFEEFLKK